MPHDFTNGKFPCIGAYPLDSALRETLMESCVGVSNRMLLGLIVESPLREIEYSLSKGSNNEYVLREKHRQWLETIDEHVGVWVPTPEFDDLRDPNWSEQLGFDETFHSGEDEWIIWGDDSELAYEIIDKLPYHVWMTDTLQDVVDAMLAVKPNVMDLLVSDHDAQVLYVIRSTLVENHGTAGLEDMTSSGCHAFADIADATQRGDTPCFVLDESMSLAYARAVEQERLWREEYLARREALSGIY